MDADKIFNTIKELGHVNSRREELREYCKLKIEQILKLLYRRVLNSDGANFLDCIFNGLPQDNQSSVKHKVKIVDIVLKAMRKESTSLTHCGDVISRLCLELPRLPADDLVRWSGDSVQSIVDYSDVNTIWRDVLPECLSALSSFNSIKHCGTEMSLEEYIEQCVHTLCQCKWKEEQLVQLVAMFKDMQLSKNDHKQVVNKICSYIIDIPPDTLPPLVHQLLKLCKLYHIDIVLTHLSHYFSMRLYSKLEPPPQDSESTTVDIDDIVPHNPAELSRSLSTCIYHISQGAAEPELIRKHLKTWPKSQLLRAPFLLDIALALSDKGADFRSACLDVIKSAIEQRILDEQQRKESAWARSVIPPDVDVTTLLKVLTTESANHRQLTVMGLINLAFSLLSVSRVKPTCVRCWSLGKLVLVRLCKHQPETAPHILTQLGDRLATDVAGCRQYAECLGVLCALTPVPVERAPALPHIIESCQPAAGDHRPAAATLDALHPLINFSIRMRDTLIMVCRKRLYSRESSHRCLALSGFLSVLRHVRVSLAPSSSQRASDQHSAHSYLTQLTVDVHATQNKQLTSRVRNEAMCMEVVSILRRCLVQDAAVKQLLYTKIYDCVKEKTVLHESVLELMYEHLNKYLPDRESSSESLLLDKCVQITGTSAVLAEPIGYLLYSVAQFLQPSEEDDLEDILSSQSPENGAYLKTKLGGILDKLCAGDLPNIDMEEPGLTDLTPESKTKSLKVQQLLHCYEALIAYQIMQCNARSDGVASAVYKLFKSCYDLLEKTKAPPKISKKGSKSTLNDTRATAKTQKSQKSQKDKGKGPVKVSNLVKDRAGPFKQLACLWDLKFCLRVVELLYNESVSWVSVAERNDLRSKRDFHQWALRCIQNVVTTVATDKRTVRNVTDIAAVLYNRCICRFQDMCDFDDQTALGCVEVFRECLSVILAPNSSHKVNVFLEIITGLDEPSTSIALILEKIHAALQQIEAESVADERDVIIKKLVAALVQTAAMLLDSPIATCSEMTAVTVKLEDYVRTSKQDWLPLLPSLLTAINRHHQEAQLLDELLIKLSAALHRIDEEDTSAGAEDDESVFPVINDKSGHVVCGHVCAHINCRLRSSSHLIARARDRARALLYSVGGGQAAIDAELKELYKSIVIQLCQLTTWTSKVAKLRCSIGAGSERVLTVCVRLMAILANLAKYLDPATAQIVRFERLLKLSGKKFSIVMDNLITYLEASQQQQTATKVIRETKLIPRLVLEAEQFSKNVILLGNKAKVNYQQYLSLGTARDFRIKAPVLQEVLQARNRENRDDEDDQDININDAETEVMSPIQSENEEDEENQEESSRRKRRRVS